MDNSNNNINFSYFRTKTTEEEVIMCIKKYELIAEKNGLMLNTDKTLVKQLIKGLVLNEEKYGKRYCPCRVIKSDEVICPCVNFKIDVANNGHCNCSLFVKKK